MRFFLEIAYNGTNYHGWQVQPNADTVQARMNYVLSNLLREEIYCVGCGRTDAGVHASQFYLHFDCQNHPPENFVFRLNRFLYKDIAVKRIIMVSNDAHTRFNATYRAYDYYIHFQKDPFLNDLSYYYQHFNKLDLQAMEEAFNYLKEVEDFASFQKKNESVTSLCQIFKTELHLDQNEKKLRIHIAANRFLRGMIRLIVGALFVIGEGKTDIDTFKQIVSQKGILPYNRSAPACGLYLSDVRYDFIN